MSKTSNRWKTAQKSEKAWWNTHSNQVNLAFYKEYADEMLEQLSGIVEIEDSTTILEIGSGAAGIITCLESSHKYAVDPLEDYFASIAHFREYRDPRVVYQTAKAEQLPFEDSKFDLLISDNVLDHCDNIDLAFQEMNRVLTPQGKIYLRLNIYTGWGKIIRTIVEKLRIDPGHPYTFTHRTISTLFKTYHLQPIKSNQRGFWLTWRREIVSGQIKLILKALTFCTPNKTMSLLEKQP